MSAAIHTFPADRVVRRPIPADLGCTAVILTQNGESLVFDTPEDFWTAARDGDPELKRLHADAEAAIAQANAAISRANARETRAQAVLTAAAERRDRVRAGLLMAAAVAVCLLIIGA